MEQNKIPIIDTHCHVYPDSIAEHAAAAIGKFYDYPIEADGRVDTLLQLGAQAGISHHVLCSVATTPHQVASVNRFIHATATAHPGRFSGLGALHPDSPDQQADVEHILSLGLKGVKLHPDFQQVALDDPRYLAMFELCQGRLPILCHLGDYRYDLSNPARVRRVLKSFPHLQFVGAHFGGWTVWKEAAEVLHDCDNLMVDSSSSLFALTPEEGAALVRIYGADRVMFGVDYPMWSPVSEMERFLRMPIDEEEREKILWKNAAAFYDIDVEPLAGGMEQSARACTAHIRAAAATDMPELLRVYAAARRYMAENGNPTQWGTTTPSEMLLASDMEKRQLYVFEDADGIYGAFVLQQGEDPCYRAPVSGAWRSDTPYVTIHRIGSDGRKTGVFSAAISYSRAKNAHIRIDTHADNRTMQHLIQKHGFFYCGVVRMADGTLRLAYERLPEDAAPETGWEER